MAIVREIPLTLRKLTPYVHAQLVRAFRRGRNITDACQSAGISLTTLRKWEKCAEHGNAQAIKLFADIEEAKRLLEIEMEMAMESSREVLRKALVVAAYRKVEALDDGDVRVVQAAATEILDRFHGKPVQAVQASVTAQIAVKGYVGISPDDWDDQPISTTGMADSAVA